MVRVAHRRIQAQTGFLDCTRCHATKPLDGFRQSPDGRWRSWCKDCQRQGIRDRYQLAGKKAVQVLIAIADIDYMLDEMVPDSVSRSMSQAATVVMADAIAAHRHRRAAEKTAAFQMPTDVQPGWPDKKRLMAGR